MQRLLHWVFLRVEYGSSKREVTDLCFNLDFNL